MQVAIVVAGVDDLRQAGSDIQGVVGGVAVYGLADAVAKAVVDGLQGCQPVSGFSGKNTDCLDKRISDPLI